MPGPTQRDRVLTMLRTASTFGVCGVEFLDSRIPRYSARIEELRSAGWDVQKRKCDRAGHGHGSAQFVYYVEPGQQGSLFEETV